MKLRIFRLVLFFAASICSGQIITTVAGGGSQFPGDGGPAIRASLISPSGVTTDGAGNIYFVESGNYRVRKVNTAGVITTIGGTGQVGVAAVGSIGDGGPATSATFLFGGLREGIAVDSTGNVYVTDSGNSRIRKIDTGGMITTFASGLSRPEGLAIDADGNLYVAELTGARVRKVTSAGVVSTVAGNGSLGFSGDGGAATAASFNAPIAVAVDSAGNLYIADNTAQRVRKVNTAGIITTVAGSGSIGFSGDGGLATRAALTGITGIAVDASGNLLIADSGNYRIRRVDTAGNITTIAGNGQTNGGGDGGAAASASFNRPIDVALDITGNLYISDQILGGGRIRKVSALPPLPPPAIISTVAGGANLSLGDSGPATSALVGFPRGVAVDNAGNIYIAQLAVGRVRKVDISGIIGTVAGNGTGGFSGDGGPATSAQIFSSQAAHTGIAVDSAGNLYIPDPDNHRIRRVNTAGIISTVAGNGNRSFSGDGGPATAASLVGPTAVAVDAAGNLYIADNGNSRVRKITPAGIISTVAGTNLNVFGGDGGAATSANTNPVGIALDAAGNLYIADGINVRIRKVNTAGIISTVAGNGVRGFSGDGGPATAATFSRIDGVAVDADGNLYITDRDNHRIRKVNTAGIISTFAGDGSNGTAGDGGEAASAQLGAPADVAVDASGNVYIADNDIGRVRKVTVGGGRPTISANGVVNGASFQPGVVANSWVTIQGSNFFATTATWESAIANGRLPTTLVGVSVSIGGKPAYIYYVSPTQINLIAPELETGPVQVTVTNSVGTSSTFQATASQYNPAFFLWPGNQAVATHQDFSWAVKNGTFAGTTTVAAKPGDVIILWGTGFGPTTPAAPVGVQIPSTTTYSTSSLPVVTINNLQATVYGAALAPGFAGLCQVAIQVPASLADGDWPLVVSIGGAQSPSGIVLSVKR